MIRGRESRIVRGWALLDLVVTAPLVLPPTAALFVKLLCALDGLAGGSTASPAFDALHWFFVCLAGALGVAWAIARLVEPVRPLGRIDAFARLWVSALIAWFVLSRGAPVVLLAFVATELGGAVHQLWALRRPARDARW
jgi:hypothetical protein